MNAPFYYFDSYFSHRNEADKFCAEVRDSFIDLGSSLSDVVVPHKYQPDMYRIFFYVLVPDHVDRFNLYLNDCVKNRIYGDAPITRCDVPTSIVPLIRDVDPEHPFICGTPKESAPSVSGRKDDQGKLDYSLLPLPALEPIIRVLMYGAQKYSPDNWRQVPDLERRYYNAAMRHLTAWRMGESCDTESGFPHLAHAACCLLFLLSHDHVAPLDKAAMDKGPSR